MYRLILLTLLGNSLAKPYQQAETNFCTDKQPGLFSQGCSSNVTICNRYGKEMWLLCPFDLIFDGSIEECKDQKSVAECGSMSPERNSHVQDTKGLPNSLCEGSDDGYHSATECSNSVVQCVGGVSRLLECSMGQVFDNTQQSCVSPDDVPACRAADEASSTTTSSPSARIDCEGMTDGFFEKEPCSSFFLTCSGGISRILTCPANLVFDQKLTICEYPDNVEGCRAADGPSSQPSESSSASPSVCAEDGYFSYGNCSDTFYACTYGRQITMHCPAKLAFDESRQLCDYPFAVAICVEQESGNEAQDAAANPAYQAPEGEVQNEQSESTTAVPETVRAFCEGKKDGFYARGCSSEVIACRGGEASSMLCPSHMLYDEQKRVCEYPENVPCYTAAKDQGAHETCSTEGPSANGRCSRIFTNCVEGKAYQLACDEGYVFSEEHRSCAESSKVKECSTAQSEPSTETNEQPEGGYSAPQGEESTPLPQQPSADAGYSAPHGEESTPLPQQPSADAGYSAPQDEQSTPMPQQPSADAGYSASQDEQSTPMPQQPSADAGYSAPQDEQSTQMPQQPSADAGYSAPQDEQSTQMPQQPSADAGYSAPHVEESTPMPQQPSADAGYSAPQDEQSTPMPQQPSADAGYSAPQVEESTPMPQQPSADAGYSAPHVEESTPMPQQPSADAGYSAPHAEESTPMPQQPSADAGYSAPHVEESTPMPQQPSADAGYSAPQDQQSTPIPQQPSADAGYSAPQSEETTPLPQQPGGDVSYSAPEMKVPAPRPQQTTADARRPAQVAERAPPPRQPDSDGRYSAPEMKASAPRQQRPVDSAATASVARKPTPQIQQQAAEMNRQSPKSPKPTPQVRPAASGSRPAPGSQRSAADTGRQAPMSQKPISQAPRPATGAGHTAPITRGSAMRSEQPARSNVETKPQQY